MSKKNKVASDETKLDTQTHVLESQPTSDEPKEVQRGDKGELGVATPADAIKLMWHNEHHIVQATGNKNNPRKEVWVKRHGAPSLKRYARTLLAAGNEVAKSWFANKDGATNTGRSDKNIARIALERTASKSARKKASQGKQAKPAATSAVTK